LVRLAAAALFALAVAALGACSLGFTVTNAPDTLPCAPGKTFPC